MKNGRYSPDRLNGGQYPAGGAGQRLRGLGQSLESRQLAASLFWAPGGAQFRPALDFGSGPLSVGLVCDDGLRVTALVLGNSGPAGVPVRVVGLAADGTEDAARAYATTVPPGGGTLAVDTAPAVCITLSLGAKGQWCGFNTYTG